MGAFDRKRENKRFGKTQKPAVKKREKYAVNSQIKPRGLTYYWTFAWGLIGNGGGGELCEGLRYCILSF